MPVTPVWNALLVSVVVSLSELGWTTFWSQNRLLNHCVALSASGVLTVAENLPLLPLKYSPPACQKNVDQYQEMYPRVVEPGTASPYVSFLPLPSGSCVVKASKIAWKALGESPAARAQTLSGPDASAVAVPPPPVPDEQAVRPVVRHMAAAKAATTRCRAADRAIVPPFK